MPKGNQKSKINYVDFELTDYTEKEIREAFDKWRLDNSYLNDYDNYTFLQYAVPQVLVRVFRYEKEGVLISPITQEKMLNVKILPFCKVIKSANPDMQPGDILLAPDKLADIVTNPDWLTWKKMVEVERPAPEIPEPAKVIGLLQEWRMTSKFSKNKFNVVPDDDYTFLRPAAEFKVKYEN